LKYYTYVFINGTCEVVIIFCHLDIPSKPGTPEIVDWDVDRVDLKWAAPKSNGGAAITGYIIEKKEKFSSSWDEILTTTVRSSVIVYLLYIIIFVCASCLYLKL
jgi:Fibronectin type III domain.